MHSIKSIIVLAFAAAVSAQSQISDGQIQVPTTAILSTAASPPPIATGTTGIPVPTTNGTFTTGAPVATSPVPFPGAANILSWSKEMVVVGAAVAGFAML